MGRLARELPMKTPDEACSSSLDIRAESGSSILQPTVCRTILLSNTIVNEKHATSTSNYDYPNRENGEDYHHLLDLV